jgi:F-type H+-transporting ATPase subunit b
MAAEPEAGAGGLSAFMSDPTTWAGVGLLAFLGILLWKKVPGVIGKALDQRAAAIAAELENAEALRREAEAKLAAANARSEAAEAEAAAIIAAARREAEILAEAASTALQEKLARREKLAEERIARAEADAVREVKGAAIEAAAKAAETLLSQQLSGKAGADHFAAALRSVESALKA